MKVSFIITIACAIMALSVSQSFAETIHLKDGRVIEEKIVERGSYYVITMTGQKASKYFLSQIDYIEEDREAVDAHALSQVDLSQYEGIEEDKVKLIFNYIDVSGVRSSMNANIKKTIEGVPEKEKEKYRELFNVSEIIERLIPIYSKYYSKVDLINMIQFYESPTGRNVLSSTPEIMKETVGVSIEYIKEKTKP